MSTPYYETQRQRLLDLVEQNLTLDEMHKALGYKGPASYDRVMGRLGKFGITGWEPAHWTSRLWGRSIYYGHGTLLTALYKVAFRKGLAPFHVADKAGVSRVVLRDMLNNRRRTHIENVQAFIDVVGAAEVYSEAMKIERGE